MGYGTYSVVFDYGGGTGGTGPLQRVIPLPMNEQVTDVLLSLGYDNFDPVNQNFDWPDQIPGTVRIFTTALGAPVATFAFTLYPGRNPVGRLDILGTFAGFLPGDMAASVTLFPEAGEPPPPGKPGSAYPNQKVLSVTALVEYSTP